MSFTDVQICANALVRLGAEPIQSFDDGTQISTTCASIYTFKKEYMLAVYPWRFTMKFIQLSRLVTAPTAQWQYQYALPADRVSSGMPAVFQSDGVSEIPARGFNIVGDKMMSNHEELWVKYQANVDESIWAPYFVELMVNVMMVELSFNVTDNASLRQELNSMTYGIPSEYGVGGLYGRAMMLDSRDYATVQILDDPLLEARFGGVN